MLFILRSLRGGGEWGGVGERETRVESSASKYQLVQTSFEHGDTASSRDAFFTTPSIIHNRE